MKAFFKKLERAAERIVGDLDYHLQEPLVHAISGEVFTHDPTLPTKDRVMPVADTQEMAAMQPVIEAVGIEDVQAHRQPALMTLTIQTACDGAKS